MRRIAFSLALLATAAACGSASPTGPDAARFDTGLVGSVGGKEPAASTQVMGSGGRDASGLVGSGVGRSEQTSGDGGILGSGGGKEDGGLIGSGCCAAASSTADASGGKYVLAGGRTESSSDDDDTGSLGSGCCVAASSTADASGGKVVLAGGRTASSTGGASGLRKTATADSPQLGNGSGRSAIIGTGARASSVMGTGAKEDGGLIGPSGGRTSATSDGTGTVGSGPSRGTGWIGGGS